MSGQFLMTITRRRAVDYSTTSPLEVDRAYDNSAAFKDVAEWRSRWAQRVADMLPVSGAQKDVCFGKDVRQSFDYFPGPHPDAPIAVFWHGGFWCRNSKQTFCFLVEAFHRAGYATVMAGYRLAPDASMQEMVEDAALCLDMLVADFNSGARGVMLVGWSAGAQLAVMQAARREVLHVVGISGIYDLSPMRYGSINSVLKLDDSAVRQYSPALNLPEPGINATIAYGTAELFAFVEQSEFMAHRWSQHGANIRLMPLLGRHHHSVLEELHEATGLLARRIVDITQMKI
jgi:arylformamidase